MQKGVQNPQSSVSCAAFSGPSFKMIFSHTDSLVLALATAVIMSPVPVGAQIGSDRSAQVGKVLQVVEDYIATERSSAGERVQRRSGMLEFSFRSTRENGNFRVLSERDWREWEMKRPAGVQRLQLIGQPQVKSIGDDLVRVHCAVHVNTVEGGKNWEGVSMRSFDVRIRDGGPRIRHEHLLAAREGIKPGQWKKLRKTDNGVRSNLRSSPTTQKNNIVGKVASKEAVHVWDQENERWLFVRTENGLTGFLHRSQIDFSVPPQGSATPSEEQAEHEIRQQKNHPFGMVLPGRPGYILNPYTNTIVDVRGLPVGTLVRDPRDPVKRRAFRVPFEGAPGRAVIVKED